MYTELLVDWFTAYYNSVARHFCTKPFRPIDVSSGKVAQSGRKGNVSAPRPVRRDIVGKGMGGKGVRRGYARVAEGRGFKGRIEV